MTAKINNIKSLRIAQGLTQEQVANSLGVSQPAYCQWESGETGPASVNLIALARFFSVSIDRLIGGGEDEQPGRRTDSQTDR